MEKKKLTRKMLFIEINEGTKRRVATENVIFHGGADETRRYNKMKNNKLET